MNDITPPSMPGADDAETRPVIRLVAGAHRRAERGHPWIYSNEIVLDEAAKALPEGAVVTIVTAEGKKLGIAGFNGHALVALRIFDRDHGRRLDTGFFVNRLRRALHIREASFAEPYYRLVHADADGLPGLIVDRYGDAVCCQANTATMTALEPLLIEALDQVVKPKTIVFRNDSAARGREGLDEEVRVVRGEVAGPLRLVENGASFLADLTGGQKTGWFYDQRPNRAFMAGLAKGRSVLDAYAFTGGFGVLAATAGAAAVTLLDRSAAALALGQQAAALNDVAARVKPLEGEAFETLEKLGAAKERFDIVILDPPAFVKSKKDLGPGSRGYRKMVRLGSGLVGRGGFLFAASCSHNMPLDLFTEAVRAGLNDAGRTGRLIHTGFAGPDHPVHLALPESAYLKALVIAVE